MIKKILKNVPYVRDIQHFVRLCAQGKYRYAHRFLVARFWATAKLRRSRNVFGKPVTTDAYSLHLVCSHRDVSQLLWALVSWHHATGESPQVYVHDDGSLTQCDIEVISRLFPDVTIVVYAVATKQVLAWLEQFPRARAIRSDQNFPMAVKMFDPYILSPARSILLVDTDILWFQRPTELIEAMEHYTRPVFWRDLRPWPFFFENGEALREDLQYCNGGLIYYTKQDFDFTILDEFLTKRGNIQEGLFGFNEQAAFAYMFGQYDTFILLPADRYSIKGKLDATRVGVHYIGPRRAMFWIEGVMHLYKTCPIC